MQLFQAFYIFLCDLIAFSFHRRLPFSQVVLPREVVTILCLITDNSGNNIAIWITDVIVTEIELLNTGIDFHCICYNCQGLSVHVNHIQLKNIQDFCCFESCSQLIPRRLTYFDIYKPKTAKFPIMIRQFILAHQHIFWYSIHNMVRIIDILTNLR